MLIHAYVTNKINDCSFECLVTINKYLSRQQIFKLYPINNNHLNIDDIVYRGIYILKNPLHINLTNYFGKIIYVKDGKIFVIHQGIAEIYKKIE